MSFTEVLAQLAVNLRLDSSQFAAGAGRAAGSARKLEKDLGGIPKGVTAVTSAIGGLAGGFASGLLIGGVAELGSKLVELGKGAIEHAASLHVTSQQLGVTTDDLQRYRFAAGQVGLEQEKVDLGLKRLNKSVGLADRGLGPGAKAFAAMGISVRDAGGHLKTVGQIMPEIAGYIAKIPDPAARAALEFQLFGRSGQDMAPLLNQGAEGINNLVKSADKAGVVLSPQLIERAHQFEVGFTKLKTQLEAKTESGILTVIEHVGHGMEEASKQSSEFDKKIKSVTDFANAFDKRMGIPSQQQFVASIQKQFWSLHDTLNADLKAVQDWAAGFDKAVIGAASSAETMVSKVASWLGPKLKAAVTGAESAAASVGNWFQRMEDRVTGHSYVPDMVDAIAVQMARLDEVMVAPVGAATSKAAAAFRDLASNTRGLLDELFPEAAAANALADKIKTVSDARTAGLIDEGTQTAALSKLYGTATVQLTSEMIPALSEVNRSIEDISGSVDQSPMLPWLDKMMGALQGVGQLVDQVFGRKAGGIFGAIINAIGTVAPLLGGGAKFNSAGLVAGNNSALAALAGGGYTPRALGGPVVPGKTYRVGENGPEYVSFGSAGYVHPNKASNDRGRPYFDLRGAVMTADLVRQMNAIGDVATGRGAVLGAGAAEDRGYRRARRTIP